MQHARLTETETRRLVRIEHQALRTNSGSFGDIAGHPPRLIFGEQLGRRTPARFVLQIDANFRPALSFTTQQASNFSTEQGGRKRRAGEGLAPLTCLPSESD